MPCHSLEDFPVHHHGPQADNLLATWTALWHPALIAAAGDGPTWCRADTPPADIDHHLLAVADVAMKDVPAGFLQRAAADGAIVLRSGTREELLATALEPLPESATIDHELAADFLALGYCFLQVQLLTRQMRYASNLDERHFRQVLTEGAKAAVAGDVGAARENLSRCYDLLSQERDHYYSVDTYLLDWTLVAPTTLGPSLSAELAQDRPLNLWIAGDVLEQLAREAPHSLELIRQRIANARLTLIGGEDREIPLPLVDLETVLAHLRQGLRQYQSAVEQRPRIYGRRRFGLSPLLPGILSKLDFHAALHVTLDDGQFPQGGQVKTRWEGLDGSCIDALARVPLDATDAGVFLSLATRLAESMDLDHVATLSFAHWPGGASRWYDELSRVARYTGALGKFMTVEGYISHTTLPGRLDRFSANQYHAPYLKQAVLRRQKDPLSSVSRFWQAVVAQRAANVLDAFAAFISGAASDHPSDASLPASPEDDSANEGSLSAKLAAASERFARALGSEPAAGRLLLNPFAAPRRVPIEMPANSAPASGAKMITDPDDPSRAVVEVPALGFVWVGSQPSTKSTRSRKRKTLVADENVLRNEFFEARISAETGAVVSIRSPNARPNLLSQQLGFRLPRPAATTEDWSETDEAPYTQMIAREIQVSHSSEMCGVIESRGALVLPDGNEAAEFVQRCRAWRGSRVLELEIHLEPRVEPRADPLNSYYACRFAWGDASAIVSRSYQETKQVVETGFFEAPQYVEIDDGDAAVAVLTGGLPFHRLVGMRRLDTLLIVSGETQRNFRIGISVTDPNPLAAATAWLAPTSLDVAGARPTAANREGDQAYVGGWLMHVGARNIQVTHLSPLTEGGQVIGFRARLLEVSGRAGRSTVRGPRPLKSARMVNFLGKGQGDCRLEDGNVLVDLSAFEWMELEARW